jgi:hypothetical protein
VLAAIAALPRGQRDAVALFYLADLSHAQISARLGISVGAVKTRLHKARSALQTRLADLRRELPAMPSSVLMHVADIREASVDARPSDAINLALVTGAPVLVEEAVLAQAAESEREIGEELAAALASPRDARAIADEIRARMTGGGSGA